MNSERFKSLSNAIFYTFVCVTVYAVFCVDLELTEEELEDTKGATRICISKTTQWPKENVQKDKQQSIKHAYKTKDRETQTSLKTGGEHRSSRRVSRTMVFKALIKPIR